MAQTGWGKLHHMADVTSYFASLGVPLAAATTPAIVLLEFVGGIMIMLGLGSRLLALLLTGDMIVAFLLGDRDKLLLVFSDPDKFYSAAPYPFLLAYLIVLIFGPGLFSLDAILARKWKRASAAAGS